MTKGSALKDKMILVVDGEIDIIETMADQPTD